MGIIRRIERVRNERRNILFHISFFHCFYFLFYISDKGLEGEEFPALFRLWEEYQRAEDEDEMRKDTNRRRRMRNVERAVLGTGNMASLQPLPEHSLQPLPERVQTMASVEGIVRNSHELLNRTEGSTNKRDDAVIITREPTNNRANIDLVTVSGRVAEGKVEKAGRTNRVINLPYRPLERLMGQKRTTMLLKASTRRKRCVWTK